MNITLDIDEQRVLEALKRLDDEAISEAILKAVGIEALIPYAKIYPPPRRAPFEFVSLKQRRWFFWALKNGIITVPYRRTYVLQNAWRYEPQTAFTAAAKNDTKYARYVVGLPDQQARYHSGWWNASTQIATYVENETAEPVAEDAVMQLIGRVGLR
jgi:hypothetical protein